MRPTPRRAPQRVRNDVAAHVESARPVLRPLVQSLEEWAQVGLLAAIEERSPPSAPHRRIADQFGIWLAVHEPGGVRRVCAKWLDARGLAFEDTLRVATGTLADASKAAFETVAPGLLRSPWRDGSDAARLLVTGLFRKLPFHGRPVAMAPAADTLLVADGADAAALARLAELAEAALRAPRPLSAAALALGPTGWAPLMLDNADPAHAGLIALKRRQDIAAYAAQKDLLDTLHTVMSRDVLVAPLWQDAEAGTVTTWTEGVTALLPRADWLMLAGRNGTARRVPWAWAQGRLRPLMRPQALVPERYLVSGFPDRRLLEHARG